MASPSPKDPPRPRRRVRLPQAPSDGRDEGRLNAAPEAAPASARARLMPAPSAPAGKVALAAKERRDPKGLSSLKGASDSKDPLGSKGPPGAKGAPVPKGAPDPAALIAWYDAHRRRLPWRAEPGRRADPYHVFLSEIMLQQTTVKAVIPYFGAFLVRWPTVTHLAEAPLEEVLSQWAGLGYYARARNLHACAKAVVARHCGAFPEEEDALSALPGIGPYTAAAISAIAFDRPASPVDGNIERVVSRLFALEEALPKAKPALRALAASLTPAQRPGDFAQAMMDLGATICTPRSPACALCPFMAACRARAEGDPARYPIKAPKAEKPTRTGTAFLAVRADGAVLLRTRPDKGLLAKMTEVPSTPWRAATDQEGAAPARHAPLDAPWRALPGHVAHVFTHFALKLSVWRADLPQGATAPEGARFVLPRDFDREALPSVMRKVLAHGHADRPPQKRTRSSA